MNVTRGNYRGLKLDSLEGNDTRPTLAKVKEAIFSMLTNHTYDATVLDLFSGSGALGIEAISNNAKHVDFNDKNIKAVKIITQNLSKIKENNYTINNLDYLSMIEKAKENKIKYDIVFLDPPYHLHLINDVIKQLDNNDILSEDVIIVCESNTEEKVNQQIGNLEQYKEKKYGSTIVRMFRRI